MVHHPYLILERRWKRLLPILRGCPRQLLFAMRWLRVPEDQRIYIVPEL